MLFGAGCAVVVSSLNQAFDSDRVATGRKRLEPIPVSRKVCPYVRAMHDAANRFQRANPVYAEVFAPEGPEVPWPVRRARLQRSLDVLEFSVVASRRHFPPRISARLREVVRSIRRARPDVDRSTDVWDLFSRTIYPFQDGQWAFGDASDLVGDACGVRLAADPL